MSRVRVRVWPVDRALGVNKQQGRGMPGLCPHQGRGFHESPAISALFTPLGSLAWSPAARSGGHSHPTSGPCQADPLSLPWAVGTLQGRWSPDRKGTVLESEAGSPGLHGFRRQATLYFCSSVCLHRQVSSLTLRPETKAPRQGVCPGSQITPTGPKLQPGPASETSQNQM